MGIKHGSSPILMPRELLDVAYIPAAFQKSGSTGVPEAMNAALF
jgi:hypothetical protein